MRQNGGLIFIAFVIVIVIAVVIVTAIVFVIVVIIVIDIFYWRHVLKRRTRNNETREIGHNSGKIV